MSQQVGSNYAIFWLDQDGEVHLFGGYRSFAAACRECRKLRAESRRSRHFDKAWVAGSKFGRDVALY
jgi:hypothetical protein